MNKIDQAILNALKVNLGYKEGERVAVVMQEWNPKFEEKSRQKLKIQLPCATGCMKFLRRRAWKWNF